MIVFTSGPLQSLRLSLQILHTVDKEAEMIDFHQILTVLSRLVFEGCVRNFIITTFDSWRHRTALSPSAFRRLSSEPSREEETAEIQANIMMDKEKISITKNILVNQGWSKRTSYNVYKVWRKKTHRKTPFPLLTIEEVDLSVSVLWWYSRAQSITQTSASIL